MQGYASESPSSVKPPGDRLYLAFTYMLPCIYDNMSSAYTGKLLIGMGGRHNGLDCKPLAGDKARGIDGVYADGWLY